MSISLCMIFRDNERTIKRCLDSIVDIVDEVVMVDTGSSDETIWIAKKICGEKLKVVAFPWKDDFSAARNAGLEHATKDLILWLDSDDEVPETTREGIRLIKDDNNLSAAYYLKIHNVNMPEWAMSHPNDYPQMKIFPNRPEIRFARKVHEFVDESMMNLPIEIRLVNLFINHHGYSEEGVLEKKVMRNIRIDINITGWTYQFKIENYFFIFVCNCLAMYGNKYDEKLRRVVLGKLFEKRFNFQYDEAVGISESQQQEVVHAGAIALSQQYETKQNSLRMLQDEIDRMIKSDGTRISILPKQEVVA